MVHAQRIRKQRRSRDDGFTLVEILVVITILGILIAVVSPQVMGRIDQAKVTSARLVIDRYANALKQYAIDMGTYPTSDQGLDAIVRSPESTTEGTSDWQGPYIEGQVKPDPWGNPYIYVYPGEHEDLGYAFDLISYGRDGKEGGTGKDADITNFGDDTTEGTTSQ